MPTETVNLTMSINNLKKTVDKLTKASEDLNRTLVALIKEVEDEEMNKNGQ